MHLLFLVIDQNFHCTTSRVFIGYSNGIKRYKLLNLDINQIFVSTNVQFHDQIFPFGKLQYLTITRPDMSYLVSKLSQFLSAPRITHFKVAKRLLHHVK